ncbi:asparagine synthetase domain-containing 1 [Brachionus plicatilis]|uniref:Asparagine synthetase domain-containing 1 n=1 Tax=Brachionus plicatilis TaxID=10195 RepID=A0A3M7S698_BRAPC|nr:asparagine synthetase domain-containing 1 [Brachionus plicatilis]
MCGILFTILNSRDQISSVNLDFLKKRGPDSFSYEIVECDRYFFYFAASVLSLRGGSEHQVTVQPLKCATTGNILLWNGEIFQSNMVTVEKNDNDAANLLQSLSNDDFFKLIESIKGPYGFVFYEKKTNGLYFGRDRFGRRSLLINLKQNKITLTSVKNSFDDKMEYQELKANGVYHLNLNSFQLTLHPWSLKNINEAYLPNMSVSRVFLKDSVLPFNQSFNEEFNENFINSDLVEKFYQVLKKSVTRRVENIPNFCKKCSKLDHAKFRTDGQKNCEHSKIAVLFSGGVDSTVLAALVDECIAESEPIDLLNIAFEKPGVSDQFMVPDRISGIKSLQELNPKRNWKFVEINVTLDELRKERDQLIKHLLYPHQTVLDDSIGCALWFASRGKGKISNVDYTSNAEVLILGMGADEQLGGYARHRTRYEKDGMKSFCDELKMEMERISERNLGRDDRILSDHGKESRLPFLDEDVVSFLNELKVVEKCNMKLERGHGEKFLLRKLALDKFGLQFSSRLQKRAIQFGSRVAKIENLKEKASDPCDRIVHNLNFE